MTDISKIRPPTGIVPPNGLPAQQGSYKDGSPIALYASARVEANDQNTPAVLALRNPTPYPIEISEIRLHSSVNAVAGTVLLPGAVPGMFGAQIAVGGIPISEDFVPTWLYDNSEQALHGETLLQTAGPATDPRYASFYKWRLSSPMLVLPGEVVNVGFINYGLTGTPMQCAALLTGRVVVGHPLPGSRVLPYVAGWANAQIDTTPWTGGDTTPIEVDSTENDLRNKSNESVIIRKLTGRLLLPFQSKNAIGSDAQQPIDDMLFDFAGRTSAGYELTKDFIPFRLFFGADTRAFPACALVLDPGDYIMAQVRATLRNITPYVDGMTNYYPPFLTPVIPQIGMVGERLVAI